MNLYIAVTFVLLAAVVNSVESSFSSSTSSSGRLFAKRSGVRNTAVPLESIQVSHQVDCVSRCMRRPGCHCCNLGPINNVTKNRACELLSGESISPATGGAAADWTMFVGKVVCYTVPSPCDCLRNISFFCSPAKMHMPRFPYLQKLARS